MKVKVGFIGCRVSIVYISKSIILQKILKFDAQGISWFQAKGSTRDLSIVESRSYFQTVAVGDGYSCRFKSPCGCQSAIDTEYGSRIDGCHRNTQIFLFYYNMLSLDEATFDFEFWQDRIGSSTLSCKQVSYSYISFCSSTMQFAGWPNVFVK